MPGNHFILVHRGLPHSFLELRSISWYRYILVYSVTLMYGHIDEELINMGLGTPSIFLLQTL